MIRRYLRLFHAQMRASVLVGLQYRYDFLLEGLMCALKTLTALVPLFVVFQHRETVAGWSFGASLLVTGSFTLLDGVLGGAITPSLVRVVELIQRGTLDFVLIKPADAQFLVSTSKLELWRVTSVLTAAAVFAYAFHLLGHGPSPLGLLSAAVLFVCSIVVLYSLWILTVSASFFVVKLDAIGQLFGATYDAARWPITVFRGFLRFLFTFVIPLALMTTFPAEALLGQLPAWKLAASVVGAGLFGLFARRVWLRSLAHYTSASS